MMPRIRIRIQKGDLLPAMAHVWQLLGSAEQKTLNTMEVEHDDSCAIFLAVERHGYEALSVCNCAPHLVIQLHTDNTTLAPVIQAWIADHNSQFPNT